MASYAVFLAAAANFITVFGCRYEDIARCTLPVQEQLNDTRVTFALTEKDLDDYCYNMIQAHSCIRREIKNCPGDTKKLYETAMFDERSVMDEVCSPGQARDEYLLHARCFKEMLMVGGLCHAAYLHLMKVTGDLPDFRHLDDSDKHYRVIANICCAYEALDQCYRDNTEKKCGKNALETSRRSLAKLNGGMARSCSKVKRSCGGRAVSSSASPFGGVSILKELFVLVRRIGALTLRM